jgi:hypothetical protein
MVEEINVSCPGCNSVFSVPIEFCGETAECAECGVLFEIPSSPEKPGDKNSGASATVDSSSNTNPEVGTDTGPIKGVESKNVTDTTNTVKLSRSGIGMIPEIKDSFQFTTDARPPAFSKPKPKPKSASPSKPAGSKTIKKEIMLPDWVKLDIRKNEEIIAVKETTASIFNAPAMIAAVTVLAGVIAIITVHLGNMYIALASVLAIAVAAFIVAFSMLAKKRRQALILTDERAIYIGDKKIEANM